jgi:hypothetical protein
MVKDKKIIPSNTLLKNTITIITGKKIANLKKLKRKISIIVS